MFPLVGEGAFQMTIMDWAAFTIPIMKTAEQPSPGAMRVRVGYAVEALADIIPAIVIHSESLIECTPQRPYRYAWQCPTMGYRVNADWMREEMLIVFNGSACEQLRKLDASAINQVLLAVEHSGTRLDLATDIETQVDIQEVSNFKWSERITSTSIIKSGAGDTLYVGSRKSEAFARVYRYHEPHPRARLLRVEHELKKARARAVASVAAVHGIEVAQRSVAERFGYKHPTLMEAFSGRTVFIKTEEHKRTMAKTEIWLMTQCAPAFARLVKEGVIEDPKAWVERYMLGDI